MFYLNNKKIQWVFFVKLIILGKVGEGSKRHILFYLTVQTFVFIVYFFTCYHVFINIFYETIYVGPCIKN